MTSQPKIFTYRRPPLEHGKTVVRMHRTENMYADVQVVREGGDNNLHAHTGIDGLWMVLGGRVRFYGEEDKLVAELGVHESILMPHGFPYWFESVGEDPLEILHIAVSVPNVKDQRIDRTALKAWQLAARRSP